MRSLAHMHHAHATAGQDVIPHAVASGLNVMGLELEGPWRDVGGSVRDYYEASMVSESV